MLVDVLGRFKMTGDRATFYPLEGEVAYQGLENLGLERVAQLITENTDQLTWQVSGTVTEYRGDNFILVSKAVLQNQNEVADGVNSRPGARSRTPQRKTGYNSPKKS